MTELVVFEQTIFIRPCLGLNHVSFKILVQPTTPWVWSKLSNTVIEKPVLLLFYKLNLKYIKLGKDKKSIRSCFPQSLGTVYYLDLTIALKENIPFHRRKLSDVLAALPV